MLTKLYGSAVFGISAVAITIEVHSAISLIQLTDLNGEFINNSYSIKSCD